VSGREGSAEARAVGAAREPLLAVDHPLVAVGDRTRAQQGGVRARDLRLRHREERARAPGNERLEELFVLLRRPELVQNLGVSGIRRLTTEDELRPVRSADLLVEAGVVEKTLAGSSGFRRHVRAPKALPPPTHP